MSKFIGFIEPKNGIKRDKLKNDVINTIKENLEKIPDFRNYKDDLEILLYCCLIAEHLISNKKKHKYNIDKKELVLQAYEKVYGKIDKEVLGKNIEFLHENKRIKKVGCLNIFLASLGDWVVRRIL